MRKIEYVVVCTNHHGWAEDSIWATDWDDPADRVYDTAEEAQAVADWLGDPANWRGFEEPVIPAEFAVVRRFAD